MAREPQTAGEDSRLLWSTLSPHLTTTDDAILFGHETTPRLVAVHPAPPEVDTRQAMMRVYQRDATPSSLHAEDVPFYPFFFLTDIRLLHGFPRGKFRCKTLQGSNPYRYLVVFTTWQTHWDAVSHIARVTGARDDDPEQNLPCLQPGPAVFDANGPHVVQRHDL